MIAVENCGTHFKLSLVFKKSYFLERMYLNLIEEIQAFRC